VKPDGGQRRLLPMTRRPELVTVALLLAGVLVAACDAAPAPPSPPGGARAEAISGPFGLAFELPKLTWASNEPIAGQATLAIAGGGVGVVTIGASGGGPLMFSIAEVDGTRRMDAASQADCVGHQLAPGAPIRSGITKSGGWDGADPHADFYRAFFADPLLHLPAGTWDITAIASFTEGADCAGPSHAMSAPIRIVVTD